MRIRGDSRVHAGVMIGLGVRGQRSGLHRRGDVGVAHRGGRRAAAAVAATAMRGAAVGNAFAMCRGLRIASDVGALAQAMLQVALQQREESRLAVGFTKLGQDTTRVKAKKRKRKKKETEQPALRP